MRHPPPTFSVADQYVDGVLVVRVAGEVDLSTTPAVVDRLRAALHRGDKRVVLDCEGVTFLDSKMIEAILGGAKRLRDAGGDLAVACSQDGPARSLEVLGVDSVVALRASVREAIRALGGGLPHPTDE